MRNKFASKLAVFINACLCVLLLALPTGPPGRAARPTRQPAEETGGSSAGVSYLAIPAAAFVPTEIETNYENHGRYIKHTENDGFFHRYHAAVHLPHGATITQVSFCFFDTSTGLNSTGRLYRKEPNVEWVEIAAVSTSTASGYVTISDIVIVDPLVDNANSVYWIELMLASASSGGEIMGCGVNIRYTQPAVQSGILSISGGVFKSIQLRQYYAIYANRLEHLERIDNTTTGYYLAQVELPNGAIVNKLTLQYLDTISPHTNWATAYLNRTNLTNQSVTMASISSQYNSGREDAQSTTTISNATIDNYTYTYWVEVTLPKSNPPDSMRVTGVKIEYALPSGNPAHILSIPSAAFTGFHDAYDFANYNGWLFHFFGEGGSSDAGVYVAPVNLPNCAQVSNI